MYQLIFVLLSVIASAELFANESQKLEDYSWSYELGFNQYRQANGMHFLLESPTVHEFPHPQEARRDLYSWLIGYESLQFARGSFDLASLGLRIRRQHQGFLALSYLDLRWLRGFRSSDLTIKAQVPQLGKFLFGFELPYGKYLRAGDKYYDAYLFVEMGLSFAQAKLQDQSNPNGSFIGLGFKARY